MDPPKEVPKKKAKEEDVKEEREVSPTSSPGSSRIGRQGHGKGKGYGGKRDERELLSRGSTGSELDIQGFHKHVVNFDASLMFTESWQAAVKCVRRVWLLCWIQMGDR